MRRVVLILLALVTATQPSASGQQLGPESGSLVVAGGGALDPSIIERFVSLAGGMDAPIIVIPTAMEDDRLLAHGDVLKPFEEAGCLNLEVLHTRNRDVANSMEFVKPLSEARGVWFTGGRQWRLADAYLGTRTEEMIRKVLERGGVVGGTSAGATIQGSFLVRGDTESNAEMVGDHTVGFGFMPETTIDQHVLARNRQFDLTEVVKERPTLLGIGIDEGTAIVVQGAEFEVVGRSYVVVVTRELIDRDHPFHLLAPGDRFVRSNFRVNSETRENRDMWGEMDGMYDFGNNFTVTVSTEGNRLTATRSNTVELIQITPVMYYAPEVDVYHIFDTSDSGEIDTLVLRAGTWNARGRKVEERH